MQAKLSVAKDYLQFPQVTGRNLPARESNLREDFIVRVREIFFQF